MTGKTELLLTKGPPAAATCGGLRPNRPNTSGAGDEIWIFEESRTWKRSDGAGSEAPERYRASAGSVVVRSEGQRNGAFLPCGILWAAPDPSWVRIHVEMGRYRRRSQSGAEAQAQRRALKVQVDGGIDTRGNLVRNMNAVGAHREHVVHQPYWV